MAISPADLQRNNEPRENVKGLMIAMYFGDEVPEIYGQRDVGSCAKASERTSILNMLATLLRNRFYKSKDHGDREHVFS